MAFPLIVPCDLPVLTPKGKARAHWWIEYGREEHISWVCFIDETGECWTFENPHIRIQPNESFRCQKTSDMPK